MILYYFTMGIKHYSHIYWHHKSNTLAQGVYVIVG